MRYTATLTFDYKDARSAEAVEAALSVDAELSASVSERAALRRERRRHVPLRRRQAAARERRRLFRVGRGRLRGRRGVRPVNMEATPPSG